MNAQAEVQELISKLQTEKPPEKLLALGRLAALNSQGVDTTSAFELSLTVVDRNDFLYIRSRRFTNILIESYFKKNPENEAMRSAIQIIISDFESMDPVLRGLAVKEAGKLITSANFDRLQSVIVRAAKDTDPYVRKCSALAILSVFHIRNSYVANFEQPLKDLVMDSNANVCANAVSALMEINAARTKPFFDISFATVNNLLAAIDQTTEWNQIQILDFVCNFQPPNANDARTITQRVSSRLSHANSAVALSAIRTCLQMNLYVDDQSKVRDTLNKVVQPLVSLLNNSNPIQYVAIKSILVLLQHYRKMLSNEVSIFFCKFDDPIYIKITKLDVILILATSSNVGKVLEELYDYSQQTDVEFVRKSIQAIGKVCVQFESAADACVDKIVNLINLKTQFVVQECIVVSVYVFRRYPGKYEGIIANICQALQGNLDDHRAKAAMVWILGEYSAQIDNVGGILDALFIDNFLDETPDVQIAILCACVKFYLQNPEEATELLQSVVQMATNEIDNPDVRDRAFQYQWLLTEAKQYASKVLIQEPVPIKVEMMQIDQKLVESLIPQIGTLAVLYNKLPQDFVQGPVIQVVISQQDDRQLGKNLPHLVTSDQLEIKGHLIRVGTENALVLQFTNFSEQTVEITNIAFNKNVFGFNPQTHEFPKSIPYNQSLSTRVVIGYSDGMIEGARPGMNIDVAIQLNKPAPMIFQVVAPLDLILVSEDQGAKLTRSQFLDAWSVLDESMEITVDVQGASIDNLDLAKTRLTQNRLYFIAKKGESAFFSGKTLKGDVLILFIVFNPGSVLQVGIRIQNKIIGNIILELVSKLVK